MKQIVVFILAYIITVPPVFASLSGGNYEIYGDTFSFVDGTISGGSYTLFNTGGEFFATSTTGGDYTLRGGFRAIEKGILSFTISSSSLSLGELTTTSVAVATTTAMISTDNNRGYTLAIRELGEFASGSDVINDVGDGSITAGQEEYGVHVSGTDALFGTATPIDTSYTSIATANGDVTRRQVPIGFYASINDATPAGMYSHTVRFLVTVNP